MNFLLTQLLMGHKHQISLISDTTGKELDIISLPLKSQFSNFDCNKRKFENSKKLFKKYNWFVIDVTRKSAKETTASSIMIFNIKKRNKK